MAAINITFLVNPLSTREADKKTQKNSSKLYLMEHSERERDREMPFYLTDFIGKAATAVQSIWSDIDNNVTFLID